MNLYEYVFVSLEIVSKLLEGINVGGKIIMTL